MGIDLSVDPAVDTDLTHQHEEFHPLPEYMGKTFPALCKLWTIANEFLWSHYDHDDTIAPMTRAILERAHATYRQLLEWADNLPLDMARSDDNRHHTVITHVFYHAIVLDVFRPFMMMKGAERDTRLHSFTSADASPASIYAASEKQLLRLTLLYRARYQQNFISFLWQTALLYVANVKLGLTSNLAKPSSTTGTAERQGETSAGGKMASRRWLRVCLKGYETLFQSFPAVEKTVLALLSMALRDRIFTADEARDVMSQMRKSVESKPPRSGGGKEMEQDSDAGNQTEVMTDEEAASRPGTPARTQDLKSTWPTPMADLDLAMSDPLASHVQTLAAQFHELALFEEFTIGEEEESPEDESGERMSLDN